ncbi:MAG TPA: hypothetical protein VHW92_04060 [Mycobacteriales bacterium]|nr:hypothetical protein [Mycobacteriales bacterium]
MTAEHLVCASCAHPVDEGRCSVCRAARSQLQANRISSYVLAIAIATLLFTILALLKTHFG